MTELLNYKDNTIWYSRNKTNIITNYNYIWDLNFDDEKGLEKLKMDRNNVKYKMYNNQENGDTNENGNDSSNSIYKKLVNYFAIMD
jgi:hypothetical protein